MGIKMYTNIPGMNIKENKEENDFFEKTQYCREQIEMANASHRYKKLEILVGEGTFKKVYKAIDQEEGKEVAWNQVRVIDYGCLIKDKGEFSKEISVLKHIKHPHIITILDFWFQDDDLIFITELMSGGTLRDYITKIGDLSIRVIKKWGKQIVEGLVYLHSLEKPIIHRDIKCENIFVNAAAGEVKIGDLGVAKERKLKRYTVVGTPHFMAREMFEGDGYSEKVDVYAFGMCMIEMATGISPYSECRNTAEIYKHILQGIPPTSLNSINDVCLKNLILQCLVTERDRLSSFELLLHHFFDPMSNCTGDCIPSECVTVFPLTVPANNMEMSLLSFVGNIITFQLFFMATAKFIKFDFDVTVDSIELIAQEMIDEDVVTMEHREPLLQILGKGIAKAKKKREAGEIIGGVISVLPNEINPLNASGIITQKQKTEERRPNLQERVVFEEGSVDIVKESNGDIKVEVNEDIFVKDYVIAQKTGESCVDRNNSSHVKDQEAKLNEKQISHSSVAQVLEVGIKLGSGLNNQQTKLNESVTEVSHTTRQKVTEDSISGQIRNNDEGNSLQFNQEETLVSQGRNSKDSLLLDCENTEELDKGSDALSKFQSCLQETKNFKAVDNFDGNTLPSQAMCRDIFEMNSYSNEEKTEVSKQHGTADNIKIPGNNSNERKSIGLSQTSVVDCITSSKKSSTENIREQKNGGDLHKQGENGEDAEKEKINGGDNLLTCNCRQKELQSKSGLNEIIATFKNNARKPEIEAQQEKSNLKMTNKHVCFKENSESANALSCSHFSNCSNSKQYNSTKDTSDISLMPVNSGSASLLFHNEKDVDSNPVYNFKMKQGYRCNCANDNTQNQAQKSSTLQNEGMPNLVSDKNTKNQPSKNLCSVCHVEKSTKPCNIYSLRDQCNNSCSQELHTCGTAKTDESSCSTNDYKALHSCRLEPVGKIKEPVELSMYKCSNCSYPYQNLGLNTKKSHTECEKTTVSPTQSAELNNGNRNSTVVFTDQSSLKVPTSSKNKSCSCAIEQNISLPNINEAGGKESFLHRFHSIDFNVCNLKIEDCNTTIGVSAIQHDLPNERLDKGHGFIESERIISAARQGCNLCGCTSSLANLSKPSSFEVVETDVTNSFMQESSSSPRLDNMGSNPQSFGTANSILNNSGGPSSVLQNCELRFADASCKKCVRQVSTTEHQVCSNKNPCTCKLCRVKSSLESRLPILNESDTSKPDNSDITMTSGSSSIHSDSINNNANNDSNLVDDSTCDIITGAEDSRMSYNDMKTNGTEFNTNIKVHVNAPDPVKTSTVSPSGDFSPKSACADSTSTTKVYEVCNLKEGKSEESLKYTVDKTSQINLSTTSSFFPGERCSNGCSIANQSKNNENAIEAVNSEQIPDQCSSSKSTSEESLISANTVYADCSSNTSKQSVTSSTLANYSSNESLQEEIKKAQSKKIYENTDLPDKKYKENIPIDEFANDIAILINRSFETASNWIKAFETNDIKSVYDLRLLVDEDWNKLGLTVFSSRTMKNVLFGKDKHPLKERDLATNTALKDYSLSMEIPSFLNEICLLIDKVSLSQTWSLKILAQDIRTVGELKSLHPDDWDRLGLSVYAYRIIKNAIYKKGNIVYEQKI